uniref:TAXI family TRAP transporter solute-binding subunit n=1 Tax=Marinobacterium profundum TaxID=1714300 RepID=UPI0008331AE8|nr:TAXI family TRAP transporter solute-binding subunit [Marinobacterium profundum]
MKSNHVIRLLKTAVVAAGFSISVANAADLVVSATSQTSDDYALSVAWSNQLAKLENGNRLTVVDNGSVKGLRQLAAGRVDIAVIGAPHYLDAINHKGNFSEDPERFTKAYGELRSLFAISTSAGQYVVRDSSGIKSFAELKGRSIAIGRPGGNAGRVSSAFLEAYGLKPEDDVDTQYIDYSDAFNQMSNNRLDGTFVWGGLPQAAIDNSSRSMDLRFISPEEDSLEKFRSHITAGEHYRLKRISAQEIEQAYQGRVKADSDVYFWTFPYMFVVNTKMDDDVAYDLTKTLWSNLSDVKRTSSALNLLRLEEATTGLTAEMHPGAARYFREIGLIQ